MSDKTIYELIEEFFEQYKQTGRMIVCSPEEFIRMIETPLTNITIYNNGRVEIWKGIKEDGLPDQT